MLGHEREFGRLGRRGQRESVVNHGLRHQCFADETTRHVLDLRKVDVAQASTGSSRCGDPTGAHLDRPHRLLAARPQRRYAGRVGGAIAEDDLVGLDRRGGEHRDDHRLALAGLQREGAGRLEVVSVPGALLQEAEPPLLGVRELAGHVPGLGYDVSGQVSPELRDAEGAKQPLPRAGLGWVLVRREERLTHRPAHRRIGGRPHELRGDEPGRLPEEWLMKMKGGVFEPRGLEEVAVVGQREVERYDGRAVVLVEIYSDVRVLIQRHVDGIDPPTLIRQTVAASEEGIFVEALEQPIIGNVLEG